MPSKPLYQSGFLEDYSGFEANPYVDDGYYRKSANFKLQDFEGYNKLALAPVEILLAPGQSLQISDPQRQRALTDYFSEQIQRQVQGRYQMVPVGTADALLVRIALTDIREKEVGVKLRDFIPSPVSVARTVAEKAYELSMAKKAVVAAAALEAEVIDSNSGEALVAVIVQRDSGEVYVDDEADNIDAVKSVIDVWVERMAQTLRSGIYQPEDEGLNLL